MDLSYLFVPCINQFTSALPLSQLVFFQCFFTWGWGEDIFHFSFVPNVFLSSSQWVPIKLPICSLCRQISAPTISPGQKNGDKQFWKQNCMQPMGRLSHTLTMGPVFSFSGWGGVGWGEFFFVFLPCSQCVPNMFSKCSQVFNVFPNMFPIAPQFLLHMVCPKFNSHVYKLKRYTIGK